MTGARLMSLLTGDPSLESELAPRSGAITRLVREPDGTFRIVMLNDEPVGTETRESAQP